MQVGLSLMVCIILPSMECATHCVGL